ncbi:hypothetical protein WCE37_03715 [Luteimonas sp. MJ250]|uniref:hypothetical protein n=1 Tax=Luteimonas sp. MJ250 TaxID=3129236 RepID=UPI0031BA1359
MPTPLLPQEIHLLERYSSKTYFDAMRTAWEQMLQHAEASLEAFVGRLPLDYRSRPLPEQPDIVWGERVLPNLRNTAEALNNAYIQLTHGEIQALGTSGLIQSDFSGFSRDYSATWMDEPQVVERVGGGSAVFWKWLALALQHAANIEFTVGAYWKKGDLGVRYDPIARGALEGPTQWTRYSLSKTRTATTDEVVTETGIYLPLLDASCAAFMIEGALAPPASIGYDPETMQNVSEMACTWILVERTTENNVEDGLSDLLGDNEIRIRRQKAGQECPRSGWWHTPARSESRHYFNKGDVFPSFEEDYGDTLWQWAQNQESPKL